MNKHNLEQPKVLNFQHRVPWHDGQGSEKSPTKTLPEAVKKRRLLVHLQAVYRRYIQQKKYRLNRARLISLQTVFRGLKQQKKYAAIRARVINLQAVYRGFSQKKKYQNAQHAMCDPLVMSMDLYAMRNQSLHKLPKSTKKDYNQLHRHVEKEGPPWRKLNLGFQSCEGDTYLLLSRNTLDYFEMLNISLDTGIDTLPEALVSCKHTYDLKYYNRKEQGKALEMLVRCQHAYSSLTAFTHKQFVLYVSDCEEVRYTRWFPMMDMIFVGEGEDGWHTAATKIQRKVRDYLQETNGTNGPEEDEAETDLDDLDVFSEDGGAVQSLVEYAHPHDMCGIYKFPRYFQPPQSAPFGLVVRVFRSASLCIFEFLLSCLCLACFVVFLFIYEHEGRFPAILVLPFQPLLFATSFLSRSSPHVQDKY